MSLYQAAPSYFPPPLQSPWNPAGSSVMSGISNNLQPKQDRFERVSHVIINPFNNRDYLISAEINASGDIVQAGLVGRQYLGHLDAQGNYKLVNGLQGNFFKDPYLTLSPSAYGETFQEQSNLLATNLKKTERQRAILGSEIPLIRANLTSHGINGQGIKVGILDPLEKDNKGNWKSTSHSQLVGKTINDPAWGVAPGTQVVDLGEPPSEGLPPSASDNLLECQAYLINSNSRVLNDTTRQIHKAIQLRNPQLRILNLTFVTNISSDYERLIRHLLEKDDGGYYKYPQLRASILGNSVYESPRQQFIACQQFIDKTMKESPVLTQAYQQYVEATRQAAKTGIITVVGVGNDNKILPYDIPLIPGSDFSFEAKSPYVISVAASNTNQTPGNRYDDTPADFSSRGDGYLWNPTISAPGQTMGVSAPIEDLAHNLVINGTSFATPYVCGVIAMMLQRNPSLTFEQVKAKLQTSAIPALRYTKAEVGAGFLNPEAAILN